VTDPSPAEAAILRLTANCAPGRSLSPVDIARALIPDEGDAWHRAMPAVRQAALRLALAGRIDILRKGKPVDPPELRGVVRLRARPEAPACD
jgi:hypothetical protein